MAKAKQKNIIITCAVTGSTLSPSMSPYLPVTAEEMIMQSVGAAKAGAAILHFHARKPEDGSPTNDPKVWNTFIPKVREQCDAIINFSCSMGPTAEERMSSALIHRPEIATVIVGSMNYGRFKKAQDQGVSEFKHEWEREFYGPNAYHIVTQNTFHKIDRMIDICLEQNMLMEFECYDVGHLYILDYHLGRKKNMHKPIIVQFLTGILGGIPSSIEHLLHMKQTAEKLFGSEMELFIHGTGPQNMRAAAYGAMMGTNIRVGQEDNVTERPGRLFKSNAEQIEKIRRIMEEFEIHHATPQEARQRLGLPHPAPQVAPMAV
jgi:uncharacterized protein (DUF849 family)